MNTIGAHFYTDYVLCLSSDVIGTQHHLAISASGGISWCDDVPDDALFFSNTGTDLAHDALTLLRVSGVSIDSSPPTQWSEPYAALLPSGSVTWRHVMPSWAHRAFVKRLVGDIQEALGRATLDYYRDTWVPMGRLLDALRPAAIDPVALAAAANSEPGTIIDSFRPVGGRLARTVKYDRFATRTGRLGVVEGPRILNLRRSSRNVLASFHGDDGVVVALDFNALEARVVLAESGRVPPVSDVYEAFAAEIRVPRSTAKAAVISELYGISLRNLAAKLGVSTPEAMAFVAAVKAYFDTPSLIARLRAQHDAEGCIYNRFGRRLFLPEASDSMLLNTYAQSTGADVAQLGFLDLVDRLPTLVPSARPLFLLHDALIIDVKRDELPTLSAVGSLGVKTYAAPFPVKCGQFYTP